jgi:hypothetical protein
MSEPFSHKGARGILRALQSNYNEWRGVTRWSCPAPGSTRFARHHGSYAGIGNGEKSPPTLRTLFPVRHSGLPGRLLQ